MTKASGYTIVIPFYNGLDTIRVLLERIRFLGSWKVIIVDDSGNREKVRSLANELSDIDSVSIIQLDKNFGQHYATLAGMKAAKGSHVITMDEDLQHSPEDIPRFIEQHKATGPCVIYGNRNRFGTKYWISKLLLPVFKGITPSTTCSFRLLDATIVNRILTLQPTYHHIEGMLFSISPAYSYVDINVLPSERIKQRSGYTPIQLVWLVTNLIAFYGRLPIIGLSIAVITVNIIAFSIADQWLWISLIPVSALSVVVLVGYIFARTDQPPSL